MTARAQCVHPDFSGHIQLLNILLSLFNCIFKKSQQVIWERKHQPAYSDRLAWLNTQFYGYRACNYLQPLPFIG
jgi:hypothetical protein